MGKAEKKKSTSGHVWANMTFHMKTSKSLESYIRWKLMDEDRISNQRNGSPEFSWLLYENYTRE
ncbi:unnamed protein product [Prunus armeniaca]|uniref:Uncharacterized protein n=1 Tax=Prunus armeniaca TaxID=36596 RepID=A0A6J5X6I5_PRUAR|nr:unnamed protein product [Prunus armeniaca]